MKESANKACRKVVNEDLSDKQSDKKSRMKQATEAIMGRVLETWDWEDFMEINK